MRGMKTPPARLAVLAALLSAVACGGGSPSQPSPTPSAGGAARFPSYNTSPLAPDATGMGSTATELARRVRLGLNIGNTLEATGGETNWGNPRITDDFIHLAKRSGFQAIRLPASWDQYADRSTARIDPGWLSRVRQVVQYCVDDGLYVVVNIHWDGGWLENNVSPERQEENSARQKAYWEQIATQLRDFDERVWFAGANEPNAATATQMEVLLKYHQSFIDAVRSTGGRNAYRVLVVQGPNTDIETTSALMTRLPTDTVPGRLMAEVHYYTPWNFTGMTKDESWGNQFFYWGKGFHSASDVAHNATWGEEETVDRLLALTRRQFADKGIPVVVGEFGAMRRENLVGDSLRLHLASRAYYLEYVTRQATANALVPFYWDTGSLLGRSTNTVLDPQSLDALLAGASD